VRTTATESRVCTGFCLLVLCLLLGVATAAFGLDELQSERSCSIAGGTYDDCNGDGCFDQGDVPLCAAYILCQKVLGVILPIDIDAGTTFNFTGLRKNRTYYVFQVPPLGYMASNAIPGPGAIKEDDDCICVCTEDSICYEGNYFLDCKIKPCIDVEKTACPIAAPAGTQVTYTYRVTNCGNVPLCDVKVVDDKLGDLTCDFKKANHNSGLLPCHRCVTFCETITMDSETCNPLVNCVNVCGEFLCEKVYDEACVEVCRPVTISGGAFHDFTCNAQFDPADTPLDGATFSLTDLVDNPVKDIFGNTVSPQVGSTYSFTNLKPGQYVVTETNPAGYNSTNSFPGPNAAKLTDDAIQVYALVHPNHPHNDFLDCFEGPCISVDKQVFPAVAAPESNVNYTFKICNCGSVPLTGITLIDSVLGNLTAAFTAANGGSDALDPGGCVEFGQPFVVPQDPGLHLCNTVTATGNSQGAVVNDSDEVCLDILLPNPGRRCFLPVTFTREGWAAFCDPNNSVIKGGMVYNRFSKAFFCFSFCGNPSPGKLIIGGKKRTITYTSATSSLDRLCILFSQPCGPCAPLKSELLSPWRLTPSDGGGCLAVETIVLLMNVAYNDARLMPRMPGYDLECFSLAQGPFQGKMVSEVLNIANAILSGDPACKYGLKDCSELVEILQRINANYEFVDFDVFNDRGYLIPSRPLGLPDPPHCTGVPISCVL